MDEDWREEGEKSEETSNMCRLVPLKCDPVMQTSPRQMEGVILHKDKALM